MKPYRELDHNSDKYWSKKIKAKLYLKYIVLKGLIQIEIEHGRNPLFNIDIDAKLKKIKDGKYGLPRKTKKCYYGLWWFFDYLDVDFTRKV